MQGILQFFKPNMPINYIIAVKKAIFIVLRINCNDVQYEKNDVEIE